MRRTRTTHVLHGVLAGALALALVAGCASEADFDPLVAGGGGVVAGPAAADDPAAVAQAAVADVDRYWRRTYPETYGADFQPLQGGFHASRPETPPPACGATPLGYADIEDNALYCPQSDYIAWDEVELIPWINENFGAFTIGIVFAHEFAHAVQARTGTQGRTVDLELQADCFAGAWPATRSTAGAPRSRSMPATWTTAWPDSSPSATCPARSPTTRSPTAAASTASARSWRATNGAATCAAYDGQRRATVEIPFESDEQVTGGNMPLYLPGDEPGLLASVETDLNDFYALLFESLGRTFGPVEDLLVVDPSSDEVECGGRSCPARTCPTPPSTARTRTSWSSTAPAWSPTSTRSATSRVAAEIARLWAQAAQSQLGMEQGPGESLQADCLTGVWAFSSFEREDFVPDNLVMSAGDLDEGIMGFLAYGVPAEGTPTAFERTDALRTGFVGGYRDCEEYAPLG